jgi:very-short-patch-repair endonuclease
MKSPKAFARSLRKNQTDPEAILWSRLRNRQIAGVKFRRQVPIQGYVVDFAALSAHLVIELDGGQHSDRTEYDENRTKALEAAGFHVLRFWNLDILHHLDGVLHVIDETLKPDEYPIPI